MSKAILLNTGWTFTKEGHDEPVTLPHTWNAVDGQDGGNDYYRGTCSYTTVLPDISLPENGRAVLQFDAVAMTATWRNRSCPMATARFCSLTALL